MLEYYDAVVTAAVDAKSSSTNTDKKNEENVGTSTATAALHVTSTTESSLTNNDTNDINDTNDNESDDDPAYIQTMQLLAEKKVREAEEKARRDEEADWFAAAAAAETAASANASNASSGNIDSNNGGDEINNKSSITSTITTTTSASTPSTTTDDVLQSIEESVEYNNQTCGFVSTFDLPLPPSSLPPIVKNKEELVNEEEEGCCNDNHDDDNVEEDGLHVSESLSSNSRSVKDNNDDGDNNDDLSGKDGHDNRTNNDNTMIISSTTTNRPQKQVATATTTATSPSSIFRTPSSFSSSSSSSASPPQTNNNQHTNDDRISSPTSHSSYNDDSMASDSTECTNNISSHSYRTPYKQPQPQDQRQQPQRHSNTTAATATATNNHPDTIQEEEGTISPLASPIMTKVAPQKKQNTNNNNSGQRSSSSNQRRTTSSSTAATSTSWTKRKNNLVISPIGNQQQHPKQQQQKEKQEMQKQQQQQLAMQKRKKTIAPNDTTIIPTQQLQQQLSNKPPTHPSMRLRSDSMEKSSTTIVRTQSHMSETDISTADISTTDISEATPITSHHANKSSWLRYSESDDNDDNDMVMDGRIIVDKNGVVVGSGISVDNNEEGYDDDNDDDDYSGSAAKDDNADLVGLEIFDTNPPLATNSRVATPTIVNGQSSCAERNNLLRNTSMESSTSNDNNTNNPSSSSEILFNPTSKRQYSNENLFFHGIYESGLGSSSFETVDTSFEDTNAEIELVYNVGSSGGGDVDRPDGSSSCIGGDNSNNNSSSIGNMIDGFGSFGSSTTSSTVAMDDLDECESVEERREVVRRIQQWRRGRARHSRGSSSAYDAVTSKTNAKTNVKVIKDSGNGGDDTENVKINFNYGDDDDDDDAIEMAPLTPGRPDNDSSGDLTNGHHSHHIDGYRVSSSIFNTINWLWSYLHHSQETTYSLNRRSKPHYDDIDFDRNTDKCYHCLSRWKKLMITSILFLLFGSLFSGDGLEKHHNRDDQGSYGENDPLAKSNFESQGHPVDTDDDYDGLIPYHSLSKPTHARNDADDAFKKYQQSAKPGVVADDVWFHFEMGDDEFDFSTLDLWPDNGADEEGHASTAVDTTSTSSHVKAEQYNSLVGIDSIVVLSIHHFQLDWLVDKLTMLYPDLKVENEFQENNLGNNSRKLRGGSISYPHSRNTKVIDPLSNEVIHHLGGADDKNASKSRTIDSEHILVVALFVNPYDWTTLMYEGNDTEFETSWRDDLSMKWEAHNNILQYRASEIHSNIVGSMEREDVKVVIPIKYETLIEPFRNVDNYVSSSGTNTPELPGIVSLIDDIQSHTGLRADEDAGWKEPRGNNPFWADSASLSSLPLIQNMRKDAEYVSYINEHLDWKAESLIGYRQMMAPKPSVDQIVVLGERHSGAEWLVDRLSRCFPDIDVKYGFDGRPGKFFQIEPNTSQPDTLVISVFLNPFDWVDLMRQNPINAPTHKDLKWPDFVSTPWERKRSKMDNLLEDTSTAVCSFGFSYNEVVPCKTQRDPNIDSFPLYELRSDGTAYFNLLKLREDKIKNFLGTAKFDGVVDHIPIRYEDLVWDEGYTDDALYLSLPFPGIAGLLEKIRDQTKLIPDVSAGWILDQDGVFRAEPLGVGVAKLDPYFVQWMEDNIDWDVEELIGYYQ